MSSSNDDAEPCPRHVSVAIVVAASALCVVALCTLTVIAITATAARTRRPRGGDGDGTMPPAVPCVDAVITWVDPLDSTWRDAHARVMSLRGARSVITQAGLDKELAQRSPNSDARANGPRHYDEAYFAVHSMLRFLPWLRRIHFVTQAPQRPWYWDELRAAAAAARVRLSLVHHRDFMPADRLPTYNSNVIEVYLDRIPRLAEHFLSFNDDVFVGQPMDPADFFDDRGCPIYGDTEEPLARAPRRDGYMWSHIAANCGELLRRLRGLDACPRMRGTSHTVLPLTRRQFQVWRQVAPEALAAADPPSVRSSDDLSVPFLMVNMPTEACCRDTTCIVPELPYRTAVWMLWDSGDTALPSPPPHTFCIQACADGGRGGCNALQMALDAALVAPSPTRRVKGDPSASLGSAPCLMVVAHPDDEVLWGLSLLSARGTRWHVLVLTHGNTMRRRREFATVMHELPQVEVAEMWDAPDVQTMGADIPRRVAAVLRQSTLRLVATHGPAGEYGHPFHKRTSEAVTGAMAARPCGGGDRGGGGGDSGAAAVVLFDPRPLTRLPTGARSERKLRILERYESQNTGRYAAYDEAFQRWWPRRAAVQALTPAEAQSLCITASSPSSPSSPSS